VHAKSDSQVLCVDPALTYPNVSMLTNTMVQRLQTDATGHEVTQVVVEHSGTLEKFT
jgi:hypothetical protein